MKYLSSQKGITIVSAVLTFVILSMLAAAIVALVVNEHEIRGREVLKDEAFYITQAGLEYAIREIDQGGYPEVTDKPLGRGDFTVKINYDGVSNRSITVTADVGDVTKIHQIDHDSFAGDCFELDHTMATLVDIGKNHVKNVKIRAVCNELITVDKITASWEPDGGQKLVRIDLKNVKVWEDALGVPSGSTIDVVNTSYDSGVYPQNEFYFDSSVQCVDLTLTFHFTDTSISTQTFQLLPPAGCL